MEMMGADASNGIAALDEAAIWVIEKAIALLDQPPAGEDGVLLVSSSLRERWQVALAAPPELNSDRHLALFQITRDSVTYRIQALHRAWYEGELYELWQVTAGDGGNTPKALFITTRAPDLDEERQVRRASRHFPGAINTDDGKALPLPLGNRRFVEDMRPWLFPESFSGSGLAGMPHGNAETF
jgi:hypothetical protein